jgi:hypothetical protein
MNLIKKALISLAMSLFIMNVAVANNYIPVLKVGSGMDKKFYLSLENVSSQTSIKIFDNEGFVLIEEKANVSEPFEKIFNLENLKSGAYTLVIESDYKETVQPIMITSRGLIVDENKREEYFPAIIRQENSHVNVSLLNPTKSTVSFSIVNRQGELVFKEMLKDQLVVEKSYNLKQLAGGHYTVVVDTSKGLYTKDVSLR